MRCFVACLLCLCAGALPADAGPWPREAGEGFSAHTVTYSFAPDTNTATLESGAYIEYGLNDRLTLGLDTMNSTGGYSHAFGFVRWPLRTQSRDMRLALSAGAGVSRRDARWGAMMRLGFSLGRPIELWRPGWWSLTANVEHHELWDNPMIKLDATLGFNIAPRLKAVFDLETSHRSGSANSITLRATAAWKIRGNRHLIVGVEAKEAGGRSYGLRAGLWRKF